MYESALEGYFCLLFLLFLWWMIDIMSLLVMICIIIYKYTLICGSYSSIYYFITSGIYLFTPYVCFLLLIFLFIIGILTLLILFSSISIIT
jgi:hypothetical protein